MIVNRIEIKRWVNCRYCGAHILKGKKAIRIMAYGMTLFFHPDCYKDSIFYKKG